MWDVWTFLHLRNCWNHVDHQQGYDFTKIAVGFCICHNLNINTGLWGSLTFALRMENTYWNIWLKENNEWYIFCTISLKFNYITLWKECEKNGLALYIKFYLKRKKKNSVADKTSSSIRGVMYRYCIFDGKHRHNQKASVCLKESNLRLNSLSTFVDTTSSCSKFQSLITFLEEERISC